MKLIAWIQKFYRTIPLATVIGFAIVCALWAGYALQLRKHELTAQDLLRREVQELRAEHVRLTERTRELEQQLAGSQQKNPSAAQKVAPATDDVKVELKTATQRSFVYTVKKGDTTWDIAAKYNVQVNDLMRWNSLTPRSRIFPGDQLTIILKE
jgi:hypothetical protein